MDDTSEDGDDDSSSEESFKDEEFELREIFVPDPSNPIKCQGCDKKCKLQACLKYVSEGEIWYGCLDCSEG